MIDTTYSLPQFHPEFSEKSVQLLNQIPREIFLSIFLALDIKDQIKLSLVCKRWNVIIAPKIPILTFLHRFTCLKNWISTKRSLEIDPQDITLGKISYMSRSHLGLGVKLKPHQIRFFSFKNSETFDAGFLKTEKKYCFVGSPSVTQQNTQTLSIFEKSTDKKIHEILVTSKKILNCFCFLKDQVFVQTQEAQLEFWDVSENVPKLVSKNHFTNDTVVKIDHFLLSQKMIFNSKNLTIKEISTNFKNPNQIISNGQAVISLHFGFIEYYEIRDECLIKKWDFSFETTIEKSQAIPRFLGFNERYILFSLATEKTSIYVVNCFGKLIQQINGPLGDFSSINLKEDFLLYKSHVEQKFHIWYLPLAMQTTFDLSWMGLSDAPVLFSDIRFNEDDLIVIVLVNHHGKARYHILSFDLKTSSIYV